MTTIELLTLVFVLVLAMALASVTLLFMFPGQLFMRCSTVTVIGTGLLLVVLAFCHAWGIQ